MTSDPRVASGDPWPSGFILDGRYEVKDKIGEGAHGAVYKARHLEWQIDLALKRPGVTAMSDAARRKRFIDEAEAWVAVGLHPNVCSCHYVRSLDNLPTVFAEYIAGGSLKSWIQKGWLYKGLTADATILRILDVAIQVAWGLEHAHGRGLVHRDVKPANLLVQPGSSGPGLTVKVTDFGLARAFPGSTLLPTNTRRAARGDFGEPVSTAAGTNVYASPEQRKGTPLTVSTDVFSFAVSVLETFIGKPTWRTGDQAGTALEYYLHEESATVGLPQMPPDLAVLLRRCLSEHPDNRPASMSEIVDDLTAIYADLAGSPYPRPRPAEADLRADELNNRALSLGDLGKPTEADDALASALRIDPRHATATYNSALIRWRRGAMTDEDVINDLESIGSDTGYTGELRQLLEYVQIERGNSAAETVEQDGAVPAGGSIATLPCPWKGVPHPEYFGLPPFKDGGRPLDSAERAIRISQDGGKVLIGAADGSIFLWRAEMARQVHAVVQLKGHTMPGHDIQLTPDGRFALTGSYDHTVRLWHLGSARCLQTIDASGNGSRPRGRGRVLVAVSSDARVGAFIDADSRVQVWDLRDKRLLHTLSRADEYLVNVALSPDGSTVLISHAYGADTEVWDVATGDLLRRLTIEKPFAMTTLCFSPDGRLAATAGTLVPTIRIWEVSTGNCLRTMSGHEEGVDNLTFSPDARFLLSGSRDETMRYWEVKTGRCVRTFRGHAGDVCDVRFAYYPGLPNRGDIGVSIGKDHDIRIWQLPSRQTAPAQLCKPRRTEQLDDAAREALALTEQAERALAADRRCEALDLLTRARRIPGHERDPRALKAWDQLATRVSRAKLRGVWPTGRLPVGEMSHLVMSRNGNVAVTSSGSHTDVSFEGSEILLWDVQTRRIIATHHAVDAVGSVLGPMSLSLDGSRVLYSVDDTADLDDYNQGTGSRLNLWQSGNGDTATESLAYGVAELRCSEDGLRLLIGGFDGSVRLWDVENWREAFAVRQHTEAVRSLAIARDSRLAVSGSWDNTARVWDLDQGACLRVLRHEANVTAVDISADGQTVISAGGRHGERTIRIWDTLSGACLREFERFPGWATKIQFTSDSKFAISADIGGQIRIWDVVTGQCLRVIEAHRNFVGSLGLTMADLTMISTGGLNEADAVVWKLDWELAITSEDDALSADRPGEAEAQAELDDLDRTDQDLDDPESAGASGAVRKSGQPARSGPRVDLDAAEAIAETGRSFQWTWDPLDAARFCEHVGWPEPQRKSRYGVQTTTTARVDNPTATFTDWGRGIGMISVRITDTIEPDAPGTSDFIDDALAALTDRLTVLLGPPKKVHQVANRLEATWRASPTLVLQVNAAKRSCFVRMVNIDYYRYSEAARSVFGSR